MGLRSAGRFTAFDGTYRDTMEPLTNGRGVDQLLGSMRRQQREMIQRRERLLDWLKRRGREGATSTEAALRFGVQRHVINRDLQSLKESGAVEYESRTGVNPARAWWRPGEAQEGLSSSGTQPSG